MASYTSNFTTGMIHDYLTRKQTTNPGYQGNPFQDIKDTLEKHGWVQGTFGWLGMGFCLVGALNQAAVKNHWAAYSPSRSTWYEARQMLEAAVHDRGYGSVPQYNDTGQTTKKAVYELLDELIQKWELAHPTKEITVEYRPVVQVRESSSPEPAQAEHDGTSGESGKSLDGVSGESDPGVGDSASSSESGQSGGPSLPVALPDPGGLHEGVREDHRSDRVLVGV